MRWTPWSFFVGEVAVMSRHNGGTHLEWGVEDWGMRGLSQILSGESLSYSLRHISTGEHSLHISWRSTHLLHLYFLFSWWRNQMETYSASLVYVRGIHRCTELWCFFPICAWTNGWVNDRNAGYLRRYRAHYDVTLMWCRIVMQWPGQPWVLLAFNASLLSNFEFVKGVKLGASVHYGRNGLKFGTLLFPDYHSLKLTIFCTQWQFKLVVSDHP